MRLAVFSAKAHDRRFLDAANSRAGHRILYLESRLDRHTAALARGHVAVSLFVTDRADASVLTLLAEGGTRLVTLRSAGYNHVDLAAARRLGLTVTHVPDYSPHAVAEHTVALLLSVVRRIPHAYTRVREGNFCIEGLLGFDLHGKTVGLIGAGKIGLITGRILKSFGCRVLAYDPRPSPAAREAGFIFKSFNEVIESADIVSLHCPLVPTTRHLFNHTTFGWMKRGGVLINTSRGGLIDQDALVEALESGRLSALGMDVYEDEVMVTQHDHAGPGHRDDPISRLVSLPNVLVTGHQGFFTAEALADIATSTFAAMADFAENRPCAHVLTAPEKTSGQSPRLAPHGSSPAFPLTAENANATESAAAPSTRSPASPAS
jgi:D-lactate dehydrogenase